MPPPHGSFYGFDRIRSFLARRHPNTSLRDHVRHAGGRAVAPQNNANLANANQLIDAYRVQGDILSTLQDLAPAIAGELLFSGDPLLMVMGLIGEAMPDSVGKALWLPGHGFDPFARHLMPAVLRGMRDMI